MNVTSNTNTTTSNTVTKTAIFSSQEMSNNLSIQNMKSSQSSSSFREELQSASKDEQTDVKEQEVKETRETKETEKASENKSSEKADKKSVKENAKDEKTESSSEQGQQTSQLNGEVSVNAGSNSETYSMLSEQVKNFMLQNGGQFNLNNGVNLMNATTRAEIANVQPRVDYTTIQMSDGDAMFFSNLVKNTDMSMQSIASEFQKTIETGQIQQAQSGAKASAALIIALQESSKTNQPFRIDFDKDVSVILQVDKEGKINANFIPGDKAVEAYLRNNIDFLRQRFTEENIAYGDLNYSKSRQGKDERQQRNKKEQENE